MADRREIEKYQIKRLWTLANKAGIDKDNLYAFAGVERLHDLDFDEANRVLARLSILVSKPRSQVKNMITESQEKKIWALMYELKALDDTPNETPIAERLMGVIKKEIGISTFRENVFIWIDYDSANKLIEVLKKYVRNAKNKTRRKSE